MRLKMSEMTAECLQKESFRHAAVQLYYYDGTGMGEKSCRDNSGSLVSVVTGQFTIANKKWLKYWQLIGHCRANELQDR